MSKPTTVRPEPQSQELLALWKENLELQKKVVKLEIKAGSLQNKINALHEEIEHKANERYMEMMGQIMQRTSKARSSGKPE